MVPGGKLAEAVVAAGFGGARALSDLGPPAYGRRLASPLSLSGTKHAAAQPDR